jgi:hypothetical protein
LDLIKRQDRKAYGEIQKFFRELEKSDKLGYGYGLRGEWAGRRAAHVYNDRYRVIWQELPEIEDYTGAAEDTVVPVQVVRVGLKTPNGGGTIYEQPAE